MARATFRDPAGMEAQSASLQQEIARILVNAPALPVEVPAFDAVLQKVEVRQGGIELVFGKQAPIARIRLAAQNDTKGGWSGMEATVIELHRPSESFLQSMRVIAARLRRSIDRTKWQAAWIQAKKLAALPADIPLGFYRQLVPGVAGQGLVRTGFNCNQNCGICWQDREWGRFGSEQVLIWIEDLYLAGARRLIISGGEPTLDHSLASYIEWARTLGFDTITLETNAIRFASSGLAEQLRDAGLSDCFVSLHSGDAAISDAITRAPGTFGKTVAGIKSLLAAHLPVRLNCVMTAEGLPTLPGFPGFVRSTFGNDPGLQGIMLSQPTDPYDPQLLARIVPPPQQLRIALKQTIDRAFELKLPISGLDGPCGPPLCAFGADPRITGLRPIPETIDGRIYLAACDECSVRAACFGARAADVELYGEDCVVPIRSYPASLPGRK